MSSVRENRIRDYLFPKRIVKVGGKCENAEFLLEEKDLQIAIVETKLADFYESSFVILDFGEEYYGGVRILTKNCYDGNSEITACKIRIRFGESVTECCSEIGEKNATNDHALRDFEAAICSHSDMIFGNTGFRFIRIDFLSPNCYSRIKSIVGVYEHRELKQIGYFECSDAALNKIYNVAAKTITLCMQSMLWDGIKRDKLVWIGDMHPEMLSVYCLYGRDECIEKGLAHAVSQFELPILINNKSSYSFWLVIIIRDWYCRNGNFDFVERYFDYIYQLFVYLNDYVDDNGEMRLNDYFLDWPSHDSINSSAGGTHNSKNGVKSLFLIALNCAIELFEISKKDTSLFVNLKNRLMSCENPPSTNKQALAFEILSGQKSLDSANFEFLTRGGAANLSTFMSYYILKVIADKDVELSVKILKEYFGGMIARGATTFWEDFNIEWLENSCGIDAFPLEGQKDIHGDFGAFCYKGFRHSLCHGWSSGAIPFLTEYVLGIKVAESGCKKITVQPNLGYLDFAQGAFPTPFGLVKVRHEKINGKIHTTIEAPKEIIVEEITS